MIFLDAFEILLLPVAHSFKPGSLKLLKLQSLRVVDSTKRSFWVLCVVQIILIIIASYDLFSLSVVKILTRVRENHLLLIASLESVCLSFTICPGTEAKLVFFTTL